MKKQYGTYALAASLALITFVVYVPALRNDFTGWDDAGYVLENPHIRSMNAAFFRWAFFEFYLSYWSPLTWMSHALDYAVWGLNPAGHHLTSVVLHAVNTFLVTVLTIKLLATRNAVRIRTGLRPYLPERSILVAGGVTGILFGLHPLHVESVAWIAERKDVLCALFYVLSILDYTRAVTAPHHVTARMPDDAGFFQKQLLRPLLFFGLALLSKPMAVSLPVVLLILDWYPFNRIRSLRSAGAVLVEKIPFFALSLFASILILIAQRTGGSMAMMEYTPLSSRLLVAVNALAHYLGKMAVPRQLIPFYAYPSEISLWSIEYLSALALVSGITVTCALIQKKQKLWSAAWAYYVVTLLPVLGVVQVGGVFMADRFTYLPSLGPFVIVGLVAAGGLEKARATIKPGIIAGILASALGSAMLLSLSLATVKQIGIWKNGITLWSYEIEQASSPVPLAFNNRGFVYLQTGQFGKAIDDYTAAIALNPSYSEAYHSRGQAFDAQGMVDRAIDDYTQALAWRPSYYEAYNSRGIAYQEQGRLNEAIADFSTAITLNPADSRIYNNRAIAFYKAGQFDKSLEDYSAAIALDPSLYTAYLNRSLVLKKMGQLAKAREDCNRAIALNPSFTDAYLNRGNIDLGLGNRDPALVDFQKACELGSEKGCEAAKKMIAVQGAGS